MKTCEDCIHYNVCLGAFGDSLYKICYNFEDKSKFIEKPFDIGDHVYIITKYSYASPYEIIKCLVNKMKFKDRNTITFSCYGLYANGNYYKGCNFKTSSVGKTVFLTQEDAQKKLEELKQ